MKPATRRSISYVFGAALLLLLPFSLQVDADPEDVSASPAVQVNEACAQGYICGYVPDKPECPNDPYAQCEVGCDDDDRRIDY